jgi:hypothetical protein
MSSLQQAKDTKTRTFTAILHWEEDVYVAECPEVGTASQAETIEEAIANLREATELRMHKLLFSLFTYIYVMFSVNEDFRQCLISFTPSRHHFICSSFPQNIFHGLQ